MIITWKPGEYWEALCKHVLAENNLMILRSESA